MRLLDGNLRTPYPIRLIATDIYDMEDVKFVTDDGQNAITKFKITVRMQDHVGAREKSDQMAVQLTSLLVASSGTHSMHVLKGWDEIKTSGKRRIMSAFTSTWQRHNHAIMIWTLVFGTTFCIFFRMILSLIYSQPPSCR